MPTIEPVPDDDLNPELRAILDRAVAEGRLASTLYPRILAYSTVQARGVAGAYDQPRHSLLSNRLRELVRLRSAQLAGCAECQAARYDDSVDDDTATCILGATNEELDDPERLVMRYVQLFHTDHSAIDGSVYRALAGHFSTAQIVELGTLTGTLLGAHRFIHTLDLLGTTPPALRYEDGAVDAAGPVPSDPEILT